LTGKERFGRAEEASDRSGKVLLVLLGLVLLVHLPSLGHGFVFDDEFLVLKNPALHEGAGLFEILTTPYLGPKGNGGLHVAYWRPLTSLLLRGSWSVGGGGPLAFHLVSLLAHLAACIAAFGLAKRVGLDRGAALLATAIFGIHPVQVESVHWISTISEILAGGLILLACCRYLSRRRAGGHCLEPALWLFLALLAKETAVACLLLFVLCEVFLLRKRGWGAALLPSLAALALWVGLRLAVLGTEAFSPPASPGLAVSDAVMERLEMFGGFLSLLVWPGTLSPLRPLTGRILLPLVAVFLWSFLLAGASRKGDRLQGFLLCWIPVVLLPILTVGGGAGISAFGDRYLYLAVFGFGAWSAPWILDLGARAGSRFGRFVLPGLVLLGFGSRSLSQSALWRNEESFWRKTVAAWPEAPFPAYNLGRLLLRTGGKHPGLLSEARLLFERALRLCEEAPGRRKRFADPAFVAAIRLGLAWCMLLQAEGKGGVSLEPAARIFQELVRERPGFADAWGGLGVSRAMEGRMEEAEKAFREALRLAPDNPEACNNLARFLLSRGRKEEALPLLRHALRVQPGNPTALRLLEGR